MVATPLSLIPRLLTQHVMMSAHRKYETEKDKLCHISFAWAAPQGMAGPWKCAERESWVFAIRNRGAAVQTCDEATSWRRALSVPNPAAFPKAIALPPSHTHEHQGQQIPQASSALLREVGFDWAPTELTLVKEMAKDAVRGCVCVRDCVQGLTLYRKTSICRKGKSNAFQSSYYF